MADDKKGLTGKQGLTFRISGKEMSKEKGYKLDAVLSTLQDADNLIKSTYLSLNDRKRFNDNDNEKIEVRLKGIRDGSFVGDVIVQCRDVMLPMVPILASNPEFILTTIKDTYKFLKAKINAKKEGKKVEINQTATGQGINVANTSGGTVIITTPQGFPQVAENLQQPIAKLTENIDERNIDGISLGSLGDSIDSKDNLKLNRSDKELFAEATLLSENEFQLKGKIVSGNFETSKGKIEISATNSEDLKIGGIYSVVVNDKLHIEDKWRDMFLNEKEYLGKCRMKRNSTGEYKVVEVLITDWFTDKN